MTRFAFDAARYPEAPGCYLMKSSRGAVLYVGKAKNLRRRLSSYFHARQRVRRLRRLVAQVADVEVIVVNNETEALVLENNLIKRHAPHYNRVLVDDDTGYYYVVLTDEELPRLVPYRKNHVNKDLERGGGDAAIARRFGPYVSRRFRDTLLDYVVDSFQLRTCAPLPDKVCLRYHLGRCGGICEGKVAIAAYAEAISRAAAFLSQQHGDLIEEMTRQMHRHADALEFERAQRVKTQIEALRSALQPQVVERDVDHDQHAIYFGEENALVMTIARGAVQGIDLAPLDREAEDDERFARFLLTRYATECPPELIVNRLDDRERVAKQLSATNGYAVRITIPRRGELRALLQICEQNYIYRTAATAPRDRDVSSAPESRRSRSGSARNRATPSAARRRA